MFKKIRNIIKNIVAPSSAELIKPIRVDNQIKVGVANAPKNFVKEVEALEIVSAVANGLCPHTVIIDEFNFNDNALDEEWYLDFDEKELERKQKLENKIIEKNRLQSIRRRTKKFRTKKKLTKRIMALYE